MTDSIPGLLVVPKLGRWASQWDQLVDASPLPSPFLRSWWLAGTAAARPRFVLVIRDDVLLGGLAVEEGRRLGLRCLRMMGAGPLCPDHLDLLASPGHELAVVRALAAWLSRPGARLLHMEGIRADSLLIKAMPGRVRREQLGIAPWIALRSGAGAYLAERPSGFRRTLRRASSRLATAGAVHRVHRGGPAVRSLEALRRLHDAQWESRSRFLPSFDRFAAGCALAAGLDELAVHELAVGDTVIAIMVGFEVAGRLSLYQSARSTDARWRDATLVLLAAIIADARERGLSEVDFLRGAEPYKDNFTPEARELLRLRAACGRSGGIAMLAETGARNLKLLAARAARARRRAYQRSPGRSSDAREPVTVPPGPPTGARNERPQSRSPGPGS